MNTKFRGATAVVGIGQTPYYKRGTSPDPELKLALKAIVAACDDAGISPKDIDGFVSYGSERNDGQRLMPALGTKDMTFNALAWSHGGGIPGALGVAASAIVSGVAETVVVYRAMAEASNRRLRVAVAQDDTSAQYLVNGISAPAQICAMRSMRMIEHEGVPQSALRAMSMASYHHANRNPTAVGRDIKLDETTYDESRLVSEPFHLFDCSRENDGAAAVILTSADRAADLRTTPAYLLAAPMGAGKGWGLTEESREPYTSAGFATVAARLWRDSGYGPGDVDVVQVYENFTGPGAAALMDHGFCTRENAAEVLTFENLIAPSGGLPINTAGGNLADCFIHGMALVPEAVRQIRGESPNQVPGAKLSLMTGGPGDSAVSSALFGSADTL
ncbi:MAG: transporter [Pseudonocardia sp. SCN 72-86]|mgnify:CR=1 FL=1|nr:MAG: transporter [Pseudonocardia sp. SCN 72-86]